MSNENTRSHGFLKVIIVICIMFAVVFGVYKFVEFKSADTSKSNSDGESKLLSRSATNSDLIVDSDLDLSSLGCKYTITPQIDISNLKVTFKFLDGDKNVLTSIEKSFGNVTESVQVSVSISLIDLGFSVFWNTEYESWSVTGGTVSYFA